VVTCARRPERREEHREACEILAGKKISRYRIAEKIGSGGMGVVYRAKDIRLHRHVALKFASSDKLTGDTPYECILREARAGSALNHPNVCTVYEIGEFQRMPFIVMELMKGQTLKERMKQPLTLERFLHIAIQICDGLAAVHSKGVVHLDIKPSNIFITAADHVKIFDFSLALNSLATSPQRPGRDKTQHRVWCDSGSILGTPVYMSPEHMAGEAVDSRTDLYSLGIVLDEMQLALGRETPSPLAQLIESALEGDRELRCQHAADMRASLKRIQRDLQLGGIV
jgi:serine/threonine protein kinase